MLTAEATPHKAHDVAAIARRLGMTVVSTDDVHVGGEVYHSLAIVCRDNEEALALLNELAQKDAAEGPKVRTFSKGLWRAAGGDADAFARKAHRMVRDDVEYIDDPDQVFRSSDVTLRLGVGNCVNTARLLCAIALAAGLEARAMPIRVHGDEITHTAAQIGYGGRWHWAEATIAADYDEEPLSAARRLGVLRDDVASCARCAHGKVSGLAYPHLVPQLGALP